MGDINKIVKHIEGKNLTCREVQALTGANLRTISDLLNGKGNPTSKTIDRLKDGLGIKEKENE